MVRWSPSALPSAHHVCCCPLWLDCSLAGPGRVCSTTMTLRPLSRRYVLARSSNVPHAFANMWFLGVRGRSDDCYDGCGIKWLRQEGRYAASEHNRHRGEGMWEMLWNWQQYLKLDSSFITPTCSSVWRSFWASLSWLYCSSGLRAWISYQEFHWPLQPLAVFAVLRLSSLLRCQNQDSVPRLMRPQLLGAWSEQQVSTFILILVADVSQIARWIAVTTMSNLLEVALAVFPVLLLWDVQVKLTRKSMIIFGMWTRLPYGPPHTSISLISRWSAAVWSRCRFCASSTCPAASTAPPSPSPTQP